MKKLLLVVALLGVGLINAKEEKAVTIKNTGKQSLQYKAEYSKDSTTKGLSAGKSLTASFKDDELGKLQNITFGKRELDTDTLAKKIKKGSSFEITCGDQYCDIK